MNWGQGLFRIWIVLAVMWAILVVGGAWIYSSQSRYTVHWPTPAEIEQCKASRPADKQFVCTSGLVTYEKRPLDVYELSVASGIFAVPAVIVFALGWAGLWIGRGFRRAS